MKSSQFPSTYVYYPLTISVFGLASTQLKRGSQKQLLVAFGAS